MIFVFEMFHQKKWIFEPYTAEQAPANSFYPLIQVTALTPQQQADRQQAYNAVPP